MHLSTPVRRGGKNYEYANNKKKHFSIKCVFNSDSKETCHSHSYDIIILQRLKSPLDKGFFLFC